jgi:hypothetical protein
MVAPVESWMSQMEKIRYHVDHEHQETEHRVWTAREILQHASVNPEEYYLVQVLDDDKRDSYEADPSRKIEMRDGMKFISISFGKIHYEVDDEPQETDHQELTPQEILAHAKIDPKTHYLVQIKGKERISYKDDPTKEIRMRNGMKFISVSTGSTPVSF